MSELILAGHWVIWGGVTLAACSLGVLLYRLVSNRLAGFIYMVGR